MDWKKSNADGPMDLLVAVGESESKGSYTELLLLGWFIDSEATSFSTDLSWDSSIPKE